MKSKAPIFLTALALLAAAVNAQTVQPWVTTTDKAKLLHAESSVVFAKKALLPLTIEVNAKQRYQTMVGFGANITDASAWLLKNRMSEAQRKALLLELFGSAPGLGFGVTRLTMGASDFSLSHYSLEDVPGQFSIAPMQAEVLPVLKEAMAINPKLQVMASPWSAPAWMKTNGQLVGGALKPEHYGAYARYFGKFADALEAQGIPLYAVTVQNEPHFVPPDYPGMRLDSQARATFIGEHLGPLLAQRKGQSPTQGKAPIRILEWDHNWDEPQAPLDVLANPKARAYIAGVAWHCYIGKPTAQSQVRDAYPDKEVHFTECAGGEGNAKWVETFPWNVRNLIIGATRNWAKSVLMWNLALDENYGPHKGGCGDCRGVVIIHSKTGEVTRNLDYYALAHASRFIRPGAVRIASSEEENGIESVAFQNADDQSIALIVLNSSPFVRNFSVRQGTQSFDYQLQPGSAASFVWSTKK